MKFTCTREHLQKALKLVSGVAGRNPTLPILKNILIRVVSGQLELSATDLEVGIKVSVTGKVEEEGETTIPVRQLMDYVSVLPPEHVQITGEKTTIHVACGSSSASFQGEAVGNFPTLPFPKGGKTFTIKNAGILGDAIERVAYAVAVGDVRPELSGVLWVCDKDGDTLTITATDSYRLSEVRIPLVGKVEEVFRVIIPVRAATELRRALGEVEGGVECTVAEGQIMVTAPGIHFVSRLLDGVYPDYQQIIPKNEGTVCSVMRADILRAVRSAGVFGDKQASAAQIDVGSGSIIVTAKATEIGESKTEVPADVSGNAVTVHLNSRFLVDALSSLPAERVTMSVEENKIPVVLRPEGEQRNNVLALVMPIQN